MARFSARSTRSTSVTCRSHVLPTTVTARVRASRRAFRPTSSSAATFRRRVMPKAHSVACVRSRSRTRWKNSASLGLDSG